MDSNAKMTRAHRFVASLILGSVLLQLSPLSAEAASPTPVATTAPVTSPTPITTPTLGTSPTPVTSTTPITTPAPVATPTPAASSIPVFVPVPAKTILPAKTPTAVVKTPLPTTPTPSAACVKVFAQVVSADKNYIAMQYAVVKAAKNYVADNSLQNRLAYNQSYITAIQASNKELGIAINNPLCYTPQSVKGYKANVKTNLAQIQNVYTANINGQLVGDPQKMTTFKPVGLLR